MREGGREGERNIGRKGYRATEKGREGGREKEEEKARKRMRESDEERERV